jgi:L-fuconolactonase
MIPFPIVDSHVHFLDPQLLNYRWLAGVPALNRPHRPADFTAACGPVAVDGIVFVEVDADPGQRLAEAEWVAGLADGEPRLRAMVASAVLERGDDVRGELERLKSLSPVRGIRRLIQNEPDPDFCLSEGFIAGVRLLAECDFSFDICIRHQQFPAAIQLVRGCPEVRFVLDHVGKPAIGDGLMEPWRSHVREFAALPNVWCKLSGMATEAGDSNGMAERVRPYIDTVIESFGFDRLMFGGDWPVCELAIRYPDWVAMVDRATQGCSEAERRKLFRDNAIAFYRMSRKPFR